MLFRIPYKTFCFVSIAGLCEEKPGKLLTFADMQISCSNSVVDLSTAWFEVSFSSAFAISVCYIIVG